jgi:flavin-dependent dehydrogenase
MHKTDILVIGAGPSGCVAAGICKKQGFDVTVVEKQKFPRFVIGESLLPRCMEHLEAAGLLDAVKQQGYQEKFGAKFVKDGKVCTFTFAEQFTEGWKWTWQVPRAHFDQVLAKEVEKQGVPIWFEHGVTDVKINGTDSTTTVVDKDGNVKTIQAKYIIDASGYGRVIPRLFGLDKPSTFPPRKALFAHFIDHRRPEGEDGFRITVVAHKVDVWIWIIPFSTGITSVGFVGEPPYFDGLPGDTMEEKLRAMLESDPNTRDRFRDCKLALETQTIEGYSIGSTKFYDKGYVLTGNATEFLDPVFSSGVTLATESGATAARAVCKFLKGEEVDWEKDYVEHCQQGINTFRSYVAGWYDGTLQDIFFAENTKQEFKNQICSVLAGYVWDTNNPFVKKHNRLLKTLSEVIRIEEEKKTAVIV